MSVSWWLGEQNAVYLYDGILVSNKNRVLIHADIWMNFEKFMPSERSQTKITYYIIQFIWNVLKRQMYRNRKYLWLLRVGSGNAERHRNGEWVQGFFLGDGLIFKVGCSDDCTTLYIYWNPWIICFKWVNFMVWKLYLKKAV